MSILFVQANNAEAFVRVSNADLSVLQEIYTRFTGHVIIGDDPHDMDVSRWCRREQTRACVYC